MTFLGKTKTIKIKIPRSVYVPVKKSTVGNAKSLKKGVVGKSLRQFGGGLADIPIQFGRVAQGKKSKL